MKKEYLFPQTCETIFESESSILLNESTMDTDPSKQVPDRAPQHSL